MGGIQLSLFGKTCPEPFHPTVGMTSEQSSKNFAKSAKTEYQFLDLRAGSGITPERSWVTASPSRGGSSMRNTGECPSVAKESTLWQILQDNAPEKCFLSARACAGILRRVEHRCKGLPPMLREALEEAVALSQSKK